MATDSFIMDTKNNSFLFILNFLFLLSFLTTIVSLAAGPDKGLLDSPPRDPGTSLFVGWLEKVEVLTVDLT